MAGWTYTVNVSDVFHNEEVPLAEKAEKIRDRFKDRLVRMPDAEREEIDDLLGELVDFAADTEDPVDEFDYVWSQIYDWCDVNRVWVETR